MDKQDNKGLFGTLPIALVLTILAGFIFTYSLPFKDERPSVSRPIKVAYDVAQDVDARLWQDPFVAVNGANNAPRSELVFTGNGNSGDLLQFKVVDSSDRSGVRGVDQIYKGNFVSPGDVIRVFAVSVPGGPYQDAAEQRMRWRYAVLSALANRDIFPLDQQRIGYFEPSPDIVPQKRVPFEWWSLLEAHQKVLLLWVDEEGLLGTPARKINALMNKVYEGSKQLGFTLTFQYSVIGPNSSTLLRDILTEVSQASGVSDCKETTAKDDVTADIKKRLGAIDGEPIRYFSAGATASEEELLKAFEKCRTVSAYLKQLDLELHRTTVTDDRLMDTLVRELAIRRIKHDEKHQLAHVAVLSEWDTFYGRTMRNAFKKAFKNAWGDDETVHGYSYMRGLDGVLPGQDAKSGNAQQKNANHNAAEDSSLSIEFPEGQNQKDYLRRLAGKIAELDRSLKDDGQKKGIVAIGVLGSDVHDKLLILEALRQYFPHKLFFTTDLDAVYSHPAKWRQTHNMLVASSFDLALREELQGTIPPFRDTYQTAMFFATQLALNGETEFCVFSGLLQPHLFEIGRSRAIPLPIPTTTVPASPLKKCRPASRTDNAASFESAEHPPILFQQQDEKALKCGWNHLSVCQVTAMMDSAYGQQFNGSALLVVMAGVALIPLISWKVRNRLIDCRRYGEAHPLRASIAVLSLFALGFVFFTFWGRYLTQSDAEPNVWLEGVSIWPSQWLRLATFGFAVGFYFWGSARIEKLEKAVQAKQASESDGGTVFALPGLKPYVDVLKDKPCNVLFVGSWALGDRCKDEYVDPDYLWRTYLCYRHNKKLHVKASRLRACVHGLAFFFFAVVLFIWSDAPNTPARGDFALTVNALLLLLSVPSTILLTMWVVQNARLSERFISCLSKKPSYWNYIAASFAVKEKKVAGDCVEGWLDVQLAVLMTKAMQSLIWGPIVCTALLMLARSPAIDDWDTPWGLAVVFIAMLFYAALTEVYLQRGAKTMRAKVIDDWSAKIREIRNRVAPDIAAIERIAVEIENIKALREGAFRPWYEWPLLQSFGGFGSLILMLQYVIEMWGGN
ncbi:MAG: hypothetical protein ACU836_14420 [Gammaproteobacteria bacterium]